MNSQTLNTNLVIEDVLSFHETSNGLVYAEVKTPSASAQIYLQGAHLTQWQPVGQKPVLFLSEKAHFEAGKTIRGGIPIIFPWFGNRTANPCSQRTDGPSHGFARTSLWNLDSAVMRGDNLDLILTLQQNEQSRALGYDNFLITYKLLIGSELKMELLTENRGNEPIQIEEALHTYFEVGDVRKISIEGLNQIDYIDKTDSFKENHQDEPLVTLVKETDRCYQSTSGTVTLQDPTFNRSIRIEKANSNMTVVWNPGEEETKRIADMNGDGWLRFVCIESANAGINSVVIEPKQSHSMGTIVSVIS